MKKDESYICTFVLSFKLFSSKLNKSRQRFDVKLHKIYNKFLIMI